jgi:single-stranded-DNA-specific exonuclease
MGPKQERKKSWESLSLESKAFVSKYLKDNLGLGEEWGKHEKFLFPDFEESLLDPQAMHDIEKAVERILQAIERDEKIAVYGDYDCDGVPGTALVRDFFERINYSRVVYYIPHRHTEGYGLNKKAIDILAGEGVSLILTIDLGTTNLDEIEYANDLKIDTIITDHHLPLETDNGQILPKAHSIINNKKHSCNYANKDLCGTSTIYKLICELIRIGKERKINGFENIKNGYEKWLLDLVAIATISDMMPLVGENRSLTIYGLHVLKKTNRVGLQTLFRNAKVNLNNITETDIGFTLGPRINSASRISHPKIALSLFSQNLEEGINAAHELEDLNTQRKSLTTSITKKVFKILDERIKNSKEINSEKKLPKIVVVGDSSWNVGVAGIIAQKIVEKYGVSCFVFAGHDAESKKESENEKSFKGSCRSFGDVHLVKLMTHCKDEFEHFGGHIMAGGFEVAFSKIHTLENILNENFEHAKIEIEKKERKNIFDLELKNISADFLQALNLIGPFGIGNEKPVFRIQNYVDAKLVRFGKNNEHVKLIFSGQTGYEKREAVKFFTPHENEFELLEKLKRGELLFEIEPGWNSNIPRLKIVD